jgi:hypothetical protein
MLQSPPSRPAAPADPALSVPAFSLGPVIDDTGTGGPAAGDARRRFEDVVDELVGSPGVTPPRGGSGFGRSALRWENKIFAMLVRGRLVLKLPAGRVDALVSGGHGANFDANKGTPMKEWFSLDPESGLAWLPLAQEALDFARAGR